MSLGELYSPRGLALEQARAVLEISEPYAANVAWGCSNACAYCYGPLVGRQSKSDWAKLRFPKESPVKLIERQLSRGLQPKGVFLCFMTDPFLPANRNASEDVIGLLLKRGVRVATSSKVGVSMHKGVRHGMTIITLDDEFSAKWEPNALKPMGRIKQLKRRHDMGDFTWVSMEPCPPPAIWEQDVRELLNAIKFVDLIIKGRWQYDVRAATEEARNAYAKMMQEVEDFCRVHKIRCHIKSETRKFLKR